MHTMETTKQCRKISNEINHGRSENLEEDLPIAVTRRASITRIFARYSVALAIYSLGRLPIRMTLSNLGVLAVVLAIVLPRSFTYMLVYPIFRLLFGTLYPAYASYKAVRTRNVKEYVKWMMYWIVFALFTCAETFTDVFFSFWFPFYYEIKIILVIWLLSPATKGSSILYRRFVHPALIRREAEIDDALARATEQGYSAVLHLGTKGVNYATTVLMQTAIKGGGGLVQQLRKSYSLSDLTGGKEDENKNNPDMRDETDMEVNLVEPRRREHVGRRGYSPRRTQSSSNRVEMYFSEVDVDVRATQPRPTESISSFINVRSTDDISSGYSSAEVLQSHRATSQGDSLVRTSSVGAKTRGKQRSAMKKTPEDSGEDIDDIDLPSFENTSFPVPLSLLTPNQFLELLSTFLKQSNPSDSGKSSDSSIPLSYRDTDFGEVIESTVKRERLERRVPSSDETSNVKVEITEIKKSSESIPAELFDVTKAEENKRESFIEDENAIGESKENDADFVSIDKSTADIDMQRITDEICQDKFDELKQLLDNAHKAVTNIVLNQDKFTKADCTEDNQFFETSSQNELRENIELRDVGENGRENSVDNRSSYGNSLDIWETPRVSRSNSDSDGRAGKYNKKPAPKAPAMTKSEENLADDESENALKATLIIKTGTVKTFSNVDSAKDVFLSRLPESRSKRKKSKSRTKEGFSKLLTIPRNIFHSAFHKDQHELEEDSGSNFDSRPRSESSGSREIFVDAAAKLFGSQRDINFDESRDVKDKENRENYLEGRIMQKQTEETPTKGSKIITDV